MAILISLAACKKTNSDYASSTITGKVTKICGTTVTLQLCEILRDMRGEKEQPQTNEEGNDSDNASAEGVAKKSNSTSDKNSSEKSDASSDNSKRSKGKDSQTPPQKPANSSENNSALTGGNKFR